MEENIKNKLFAQIEILHEASQYASIGESFDSLVKLSCVMVYIARTILSINDKEET